MLAHENSGLELQSTPANDCRWILGTYSAIPPSFHILQHSKSSRKAVFGIQNIPWEFYNIKIFGND